MSSDTFIIGGSGGSNTISATTVKFIAYGSFVPSTGMPTETNTQYAVRSAVTMTQLFSNNVGATTAPSGTLKSRIGAADGNMVLSYSTESITVPANHSDTTHSDSLSAAALVNMACTLSVGSIRFLTFSARLNAASPVMWLGSDITFGSVGNAGKVITGTTAQYVPFLGSSQSPSTTESQAQQVNRMVGAWQGLLTIITANATTLGSTIKSRINAGNGNQILSIASGATGNIQDTTHTDSLTGGEKLAAQIILGSNNNVTIFNVLSELAATYSKQDVFVRALGNTDESTANGTPGMYMHIGGGMFPSTTEANHTVALATAVTASNLRTQFSGGRGGGSFFSRVGGSNGNQIISPFTAAFLEDSTHTDSVAANTNLNFQENDTTGAGSSAMYGMGMSIDDGTNLINIVNVSLSESMSLADSVSDTENELAALSESIGLTDSASVVTNANASIAEAMNLSDLVSDVENEVAALSEAVGLADTVAASIVKPNSMVFCVVVS